jgi:hypothetical protein
MRTTAAIRLAASALVLALCSPALAAKKPAPDKAHHCVGSGGKELTATNEKECKKAKGKWEKGSAAPPAAAAVAPPASDTGGRAPLGSDAPPPS